MMSDQPIKYLSLDVSQVCKGTKYELLNPYIRGFETNIYQSGFFCIDMSKDGEMLML